MGDCSFNIHVRRSSHATSSNQRIKRKPIGHGPIMQTISDRHDRPAQRKKTMREYTAIDRLDIFRLNQKTS